MAFCKYCGTKLEEGQLCGCEKAVASRAAVETPIQETPAQEVPVQEAPVQEAPVQQAPTQQAPTQQAPTQENAAAVDYNEILNKSKDISKGVFGQFLAIWKKPAEAGAAFVREGNYIEAIIFMGIQALLAGFLTLAQVGRIGAMIKDAFGAMMGFAGMSGMELNLPYGKAFFLMLLASVVISALFIGAFHVGFMVLKTPADIKKSIRLASLRCVAAIPFAIIAIIFTYINQGMALGINMFALIVSLVFLVQGANAVEEINENKRGYLVAIVSIVVIIIVFFIASALVKSGLKETMDELMGYLQYLM